jgi:hypothetical protein
MLLRSCICAPNSPTGDTAKASCRAALSINRYALGRESGVAKDCAAVRLHGFAVAGLLVVGLPSNRALALRLLPGTQSPP